MRLYSVLLEGTDASHGYFINIAVAALTPEQASSLALTEARKLGLKIRGVEEIVETNQTPAVDYPQILSISGKSYFAEEV